MIKLVTEQIVEKVPNDFTGIAYCENGVIEYLKNSLFHREDGPAIIKSDGYKAWFFEDKRHNLYGPAVVYPNGNKEYWIHDKNMTKEVWEKEVAKPNNPCQDVIVEVDGKKYKLVEI
jgi:hypothetical protein